MFFENISYIAIVASALVAMGLGFVWYSPWLFGKRWMKEMSLSPDKLDEMRRKGGSFGMARTYAASIVLSIATAFVLSALFNSLIIVGIWGIVLVGFLMWLGFSMPVALNDVLYGRSSFALFAINSGYQLASLVLIALIVGIFG